MNTDRARLERARASAAIARLALQQLQDEVAADELGTQGLAAVLREHHEADPQSGVLGAVAQLLTIAAHTGTVS